MDGRRVSFLRACLRWLGWHVSTLCFWFGFLWMVGDRYRQGWHDKMAKTVVVTVQP
jgi:uncharacterized RDD family membrane protein YckC